MYGHTTHRIWWYIDAYSRWTTQLPYNTLNPVPIYECPLAEHVDCSAM